MSVEIDWNNHNREKALAESEHLAHALLDATTDVVTLLDANGTILDLNSAAVAALRSTRGKLLGTCVYDLFDPEPAARRRAWVKQAAATGVPIVTEDEGHGKIFESSIYPVASGENRLVVIFARDVTERKFAEARLRQSEEKYATIVEKGNDGIVIIQEGRIVFCNSKTSAFTGYRVGETDGKPFSALVHPNSRALVAERYARRLKGQPVPDRYEISMLTQEGQEVPAEVNTTPISYEGKPALMVIVRDIMEQKKAEDALKKSESQYRQLAESISDIFFAMDKDLRYTYWNHACERLTGIAAKDALGKRMADILPGTESAGTAKDRFLRVIESKKSARFTMEYPGMKGVIHEIAAYPNEEGVSVLIKDVTERRKEESALLFSDAAFRSIHEAVFATDDDGVVTRWNQICETTFGIKRGDAVGKRISELVLIAEQHPGQNKQRDDLLRAQRHNREEQLYLTPAGDVWVDAQSQAIEQGDKVVGWVTLALDISERKRMEASLEKAAREWRTTFDSISDLVSIHDQDNKLLRVNMSYANLAGKLPRDLIGRCCHEVVHGTAEPPADCPVRITQETGKPASTEMFLPTLGVWLQESTSPLFGENGQIIGTVNIVKDITDRKRMQTQMLMTDRLASIGELVSGVAHELNNPLTGVIGFSQLLMDKEVSDDIKEDLTTISHEAQRAARIVRNLLTFARKHPPLKQPSQINSIIDDVLKLRAYEQNVNNIKVVRESAVDLPEVMADYHQMQQVFLNIVINAEFFMIDAHKGGTLNITTERVGGVLRTSITDDGPGISQVNLGKLFDPFFTTKEVGKGTGLGLSICHGIVSEHGGRIYATSEPGKGATFVVELPVEVSQIEGILAKSKAESTLTR